MRDRCRLRCDADQSCRSPRIAELGVGKLSVAQVMGSSAVSMSATNGSRRWEIPGRNETKGHHLGGRVAAGGSDRDPEITIPLTRYIGRSVIGACPA